MLIAELIGLPNCTKKLPNKLKTTHLFIFIILSYLNNGNIPTYMSESYQKFVGKVLNLYRIIFLIYWTNTGKQDNFKCSGSNYRFAIFCRSRSESFNDGYGCYYKMKCSFMEKANLKAVNSNLNLKIVLSCKLHFTIK